MDKRWLLAITVLLTFGVVAGASLPATSQQPPQRQTLVVFDPNAVPFEKTIDERPKGFGPGDWSVAIERVLDPETCEKAGRIVVRFTFVKNAGNEDGHFIVDATYVRSDGKITAYGAGKFSEFEGGQPLFAVTGGTGAFRDASGEVTFNEETEMCERRGVLTTFDLGPQ